MAVNESYCTVINRNMMNKAELIKQLIDAVDEYANVMGAEDYLSLNPLRHSLHQTRTDRGRAKGNFGYQHSQRFCLHLPLLAFLRQAKRAREHITNSGEYTYLATLLSTAV